jgi:methylated-DNA-protein-cysteine methyltransferase-like protein
VNGVSDVSRTDPPNPRAAPTTDAFARLKVRVVAVLEVIPAGRVTTYGTIGKHLRASARQVARVMTTLTAAESARLPWFRVVAARGVVSTLKLRGAVGRRQVARLRAEGVAVSGKRVVEDFDNIAWSPTDLIG